MNEQDFTLDQIIEQSFDFSEYSIEEKQKIITEISGMIMETALLKALDEAGEELQRKFNDFIELEPTAEMMGMFISKNISDFHKFVLEEIRIFKEEEDE